MNWTFSRMTQQLDYFCLFWYAWPQNAFMLVRIYERQLVFSHALRDQRIITRVNVTMLIWFGIIELHNYDNKCMRWPTIPFIISLNIITIITHYSFNVMSNSHTWHVILWLIGRINSMCWAHWIKINVPHCYNNFINIYMYQMTNMCSNVPSTYGAPIECGEHIEYDLMWPPQLH